MGQAIIKRVDHLMVRSVPPEPLFTLLKDQLLLPEAWPVTTNQYFTSGSIHLCNLNLEILQLNSDEPQPNQPARLYGIAFELEPYEVSLPELERRGIPHTPPMPYYIVDDQGWQVTAWTNVYLGSLIGGNPLAGAFFALSQRASPNAWEKGSVPSTFKRRYAVPIIFNQVYPNGITLSYDYNPAWRNQNIRPEPDRSGLDIKRVKEVTLAVRDLEQARDAWNRLLQPHPEISPGVWSIPDDLQLRLVPGPQEGLVGMIWQAHSLNRSAQFLHRRGLLGAEVNGAVIIDPKAVLGLDIRLVQ